MLLTNIVQFLKKKTNYYFLLSGSKTLGFIRLFEVENGLISVFVMFVWLLLHVCYMVCLTLFKSVTCFGSFFFYSDRKSVV